MQYRHTQYHRITMQYAIIILHIKLLLCNIHIYTQYHQIMMEYVIIILGIMLFYTTQTQKPYCQIKMKYGIMISHTMLILYSIHTLLNITKL